MKKMAICAVVLALAGVSACGNDEPGNEGAGNDGDKLLISMIAKGTDDHWTLVRTGALAAGEELGVEVNFNAPDTENEGDRQLNMVQTAVNNGSDGIGIAPQDGLQDSAPLLIEEAGDIPFVIFDTPLPGSDKPVATIASDNPGIGARMAEELSSLLDGEGTVGMVTNGIAGTAAERRDGFVDWIEENAPGIEIVDIQNGEADLARSRDRAQGILQAHPDIDAMAATGIYPTIAIADEVAARGGDNDVIVVGVDAGEDVLTQLSDGKIDGIVAQNPYQIGYETVEVLVAAAGGDVPGEDVIHTDSLWVTADNIDDPEIREALGLD